MTNCKRDVQGFLHFWVTLERLVFVPQQSSWPLSKVEMISGENMCVCVWNNRICERVMSWRVTVKKEPGLSLHQASHWKRTHVVLLFGHGWLYAFIMSLVERSSKSHCCNPHPPDPTAPREPINWVYIYYFDLSFAGEWHQMDLPLVPLQKDGGVILTVWEADCWPALVFCCQRRRETESGSA